MDLNLRDIFSISLVLFSVIDIVGSLPIILSMKQRGIKIQSKNASIVALIIMVMFLYGGPKLLHVFGVGVRSVAEGGNIVIFLLHPEIILVIKQIRGEPESSSNSIVPIALPLIAGAGALTTILSLKAEYSKGKNLIRIVINIILV